MTLDVLSSKMLYDSVCCKSQSECVFRKRKKEKKSFKLDFIHVVDEVGEPHEGR